MHSKINGYRIYQFWPYKNTELLEKHTRITEINPSFRCQKQANLQNWYVPSILASKNGIYH